MRPFLQEMGAEHLRVALECDKKPSDAGTGIVNGRKIGATIGPPNLYRAHLSSISSSIHYRAHLSLYLNIFMGHLVLKYLLKRI
jgi:hypothetical protein